ncbi:tRNA (adenosine(37)-N6)-threonylcarbamoyltransferase complex transferase subunit TsaD [Candidatus Saccharibacteria bacterium]|nr:tRNA (adenosine(37)-N6)-threonylcarbamoyltransferase complex transferase subunit TsaD [Candidatus Saccharibacteria bacterium]
MKILAIETSCDETAVAVVEGVDGELEILSDVVVSQVDIFAEYGGVIPEVAARSHLEAMMPVLDRAMEGISWKEIDAIAVTHTPGLLGSLLIGTLTARQLAILHNKPLYAVHHLKSHIYANWVGVGVKENKHNVPFGHVPGHSGQVFTSRRAHSVYSPSPTFSLLALVISGGHTQILYMREHNQFEIVGTTRDDAVGECFDKVAKILGLPYPGGPSIAKVAENGDAFKYKLPHPQVEGLDFSFSGLKTAVLRVVQKELGLPISHPSHDLKNHLNEQQVADFAASFQRTAVDILAEKMEMALKKFPEVKSIVVSGGVSANEELRKVFREKFGDMVYFPEPKFAGDNAVMVGVAAYYEILSGVKPVNPYHLDIMPRSEIK